MNRELAIVDHRACFLRDSRQLHDEPRIRTLRQPNVGDLTFEEFPSSVSAGHNNFNNVGRKTQLNLLGISRSARAQAAGFREIAEDDAGRCK